jgi:hypothetical protein
LLKLLKRRVWQARKVAGLIDEHCRFVLKLLICLLICWSDRAAVSTFCA